MYIIPKHRDAKAHQVNNVGKPMCGAKLAPGSIKSHDLNGYKLCVNCVKKATGTGFGRAVVSVNAVSMENR